MFKEKIKNVFSKFAYQAVCFAEEKIGAGHGIEKKEIAIEFLLNKLPIYLKPFIPLLRPLLNKIADELIERAVEKLHSVQQQIKDRLENNGNNIE